MNFKQIKVDIKVLSERQGFLKNQRKTVNLQGERVLTPWEAWMEHQRNRWTLRLLFFIYAERKGIVYDQEISKYDQEGRLPEVNKLREKYKDE